MDILAYQATCLALLMIIAVILGNGPGGPGGLVYA